MEALEYVLSEARKVREAIDEAQRHLANIGNIPNPEMRRAANLAVTASREDPAEAGRALGIVGWTLNGTRDGLNKAATEIEALSGVVDDLIGKAGRLV